MSTSDPIIAFHLDMNFICPPLPYLRRWVEQIADMGYNAILWELENKVQWETCPECVWPEAMTKSEFAGLLDYSRSLGLQPIPLLQTIGHAEYVLQHDPYNAFRELPDHHDCYCTTNPAVRSFLKKWITEYLDLFGDLKHFHLGGDEAYVFAQCPRCDSRAARIGRNRLYAEHLIDIAQPLVQRGVRPSIWNDMILHHVNEVDDVPRDFLIWDWNYRDGVTPRDTTRLPGHGWISKEQITPSMREDMPEVLDDNGDIRPFYTAAMFRRLGFDVVLCSSTRSAGDSLFGGSHALHAPNVVGASQTAARLGLVGTCVTSWAIRIANYETQLPWILLGPMAFHQPEAKIGDLLAQAAQRLLGTPDTTFFDAMDRVGTPFLFSKAASRTANGIQWNEWKDSLPPPAGYLADQLRQWTAPEHTATWAREGQRLQQAATRIADGHARLLSLLGEVQRGLGLVREWMTVARHQAAQLRVAQDIMARTAGKPCVCPAEMAQYVHGSKQEFIAWATRWMTPQSARHNAGLIYDCVIDYYENMAADRQSPASRHQAIDQQLAAPTPQ